MTVFADSSALVKLYVDEAGAAEVRSLHDLIVSVLARVEVAAAIWRKTRVSEMRGQAAAGLRARFESDLAGTPDSPPRFSVTPVSDGILTDAANLTGTRALRAYDAVHLSSALAAQAADPSCRTFACFDRNLRDAAAVEGFALLPALL